MNIIFKNSWLILVWLVSDLALACSIAPATPPNYKHMFNMSQYLFVAEAQKNTGSDWFGLKNNHKTSFRIIESFKGNLRQGTVIKINYESGTYRFFDSCSGSHFGDSFRKGAKYLMSVKPKGSAFQLKDNFDDGGAGYIDRTVQKLRTLKRR